MLAPLLTLVSQGCVADPSGDEVGTYRVTMALVSNSCGAGAVLLQDGHRYTAQLRVDGEHAYWRLPGQKPLDGTFAEGRFEFDYSSIVAKSAPDAGPFCQLIQDEVLEGAVATSSDADAGLDAGSDAAAIAKSTGDTDAEDEDDSDYVRPEKGLVGRHVFNIKAAAGTNCTDALAPEGAFERLPCSVRYDLVGSDTESF